MKERSKCFIAFAVILTIVSSMLPETLSKETVFAEELKTEEVSESEDEGSTDNTDSTDSTDNTDNTDNTDCQIPEITEIRTEAENCYYDGEYCIGIVIDGADMESGKTSAEVCKKNIEVKAIINHEDGEDAKTIKEIDWKYDKENNTSTGTFYISDVDLKEGHGGLGDFSDEIKSVTAEVIKDGTQTVSSMTKNINVTVDTVAPELRMEMDGEFLVNENGLFFFTDKTAVTDEADGSRISDKDGGSIVLDVVITEKNFDAAAYEELLKEKFGFDKVTYQGADEKFDNRFSVTFETPAGEVTEISDTLPDVTDRAGNKINGSAADFKFYVDRKSPVSSDDIENIDINLTGEYVESRDKDDRAQIFYGGIDVLVDVMDDSGIEKAMMKIVNEGDAVTVPGIFDNEKGAEMNISESDADRYILSRKIELLPDIEASDIKAYVMATDKSGNTRVSFETFDVDTKAPEIVQYMADSEANIKDDRYYFDHGTTAGFTVKDGNLDIDNSYVSYTLRDSNGKKEEVDNLPLSQLKTEGTGKVTYIEGVFSYEMNLEDGFVFEGFNITAADMAAAVSENEETRLNHTAVSKGAKVIIDKTAPNVVLKLPEAKNSVNSINNDAAKTYYYREKQTAGFEVTDQNLDLEKSTVSYTIDEKYIIRTFYDLLKEDALNIEKAAYSWSLEIENQFFGDLKVRAIDLAQNEAKLNDVNKYVVDNNKPTLTLSTPADSKTHVNSRDNVYYYRKKQTAGFTATDQNLDPEKSTVSYMLNGKHVIKTFSELNEEKTLKTDGDIYSWEFIIDNESFRDFKVDAVDLAKNRTEFKDGNEYISDNTAPEVEISVTGSKIAGYFTNNGNVYIRFDSPSVAQSGKPSAASAKDVTLTVTVRDENIRVNNSGYTNANYVIKSNKTDGVIWEEKRLPNQAKSELTYTKSMTVPADSSDTIAVDLQITDLAGNNAKNISWSGTLLNESAGQGAFRLENGRIRGSLTADQTRPSSLNDEKMTPAIILTPQNSKSATVVNDAGIAVDLYGSDMSYMLTVNDPVYIDENGIRQYSGLKSVNWTVESDREGLVSGSAENDFNGEQSANFTVPVKINGIGESNNVTVTVKAQDNAGNITTYKQYLAIDNQEPRVTISYNNNSALNQKYFKEDRILTVRIEDLNFDALRTLVVTEKGLSEWKRDGNVYTATVNYDTDGDYTFDMSVSDIANNKAQIDFTNNGANIAPKEFTVDKTAPVINVSFDNDDVRNGRYYKADRTAYIRVEEHNFNSEEVSINLMANFGGQSADVPDVEQFITEGDRHTAKASFNRDGDYTITVNYTDLAGNAAQEANVPEFTIDKTVPEVEIKGVEDGQAYTGSVTPMISMYDMNFDDKGYSVSWSVTKINGTHALDVKCSESDIVHGKEFNLSDIPNTKENDGIYVLSAVVTDLAGNSFSTKTVKYSVNRFGSVYMASSETEKFLKNPYAKEPPLLEISEINPDVIKSRTLSISVNGTTKILKEKTDYTVKESESGWHEYMYTINPDVFVDENGKLIMGEYILTILSTDNAENENSNRTNESRLDIAFTLDNQPPTGFIDITGLKEGENIIKAQSTDINVYWEDNIGVRKVIIKLNGEIIDTLKEDMTADGSFTFSVSEADKEQNVEAILVDYAGNEEDVISSSFFLNSSTLAQFMYNTPLFAGTIIGAAALAASVVIIFITKRHKRNINIS
jgi:hypothetical protein